MAPNDYLSQLGQSTQNQQTALTVSYNGGPFQLVGQYVQLPEESPNQLLLLLEDL